MTDESAPTYDELKRRLAETEAELRTLREDRIDAISGAVADIAESKRAEEARRESQQVLAGIMHSMSVGVFWKDKTLHFLGCNAVFARDAGFEDPKDVIGKNDYDMVWSNQAELYRNDDRQVIETGRPKLLIEEPLTTPDGNTVTLLTSKIPLRNVKGEISGVLGTYVNITERKEAEKALEKSHALLENLSRMVPGVMYQYRQYPDGRSAFPYASPGVSDIFEVTPEEVQEDATPIFDRLHPEDRDMVVEALAESARSLETFCCEFRVVLPRQGLRWRSSQAQPLRTEDGGALWHGIASDITERKKSEQALRESEERVRKKLQAVLDPEEDISQLALADIVDTQAIQALMDDLSRVTGMAAAMLDLQGNVLVAAGWQDICTKFHRVHPETRRFCQESDTCLTSGVEPGQFKAYKCMNHMWDISTPLVVGNEHVGNLYLGQFFYDDEDLDYGLFRAQARKYGFDEDAYLDALVRVPRWSRETAESFMTFYSRFAAFVSNLSYGNLKLARVLEERQRIETERKHLEEQLRQSLKMESVGRLAGGVAHDFNNMLNVILGHSELALEELPLDSPLRDDLDEIRKAAYRSADLTRQLLAFARKQTVAPKVLNLNDTVESMLKMLKRLIGEDIHLLWKPDRSLQPVRIDPTQIDQLLANLVVNARDAIGHAGGKITIETGQVEFDNEYCANHIGFLPGSYSMLGVSDNGCGMDEATRANIFEPFFTTKGLGEGTGLGLATVYGIVKQNNGFINVYSEPGEGSSFSVYLPAHGAAEPAAPSERTAPVSATRGHETILLVEDEPSILKLTATMLKRFGYCVLPASKPEEAIRMAQKHNGRIHLLMTDVVMPEMNGRELARNLLVFYPDLKRLFMSGYTANVIAHHGVLDEGVNFIQKPFSGKDLSAKVREALDREPEEPDR